MTVVSLAIFRPPGPLADLLLTGLAALVGLGLFLAYRTGLGSLEVRRRLPRVGTKGETLAVVHDVVNRSSRLVQGVTITERPAPTMGEALPAGSSGTFFPQILPRLRAEARTRLFVGRRGRLELEGLTLTASDPFGMFSVERFVPLPCEVLVQPRPRRAPALTVLASEVRRAAMETAASDWSKVREWREGDPLRSVHWRLTARRGFPIVKTAELPRGQRALIVLDRRPAGGRRAAAAFEYAISLAAGLSITLLEQGSEVRLLAPGELGPLTLGGLRGRPGGGRLLEALALVTPDALGIEALAADVDLTNAVVVTSRPESLQCGFLIQAPTLPSIPPTVTRAGRTLAIR